MTPSVLRPLRLILGAILLALIIGRSQAVSALPAPAALILFGAAPTPGPLIQITWETAAEPDTVLFRLYRSRTALPADWGEPVYVSAATGDPVTGARYEFLDANLDPCTTYFYLLADIDSAGKVTQHGPVSTTSDCAYSCGSVTSVLPAECELLVALFERTNGPDWRQREGWLVTDTPCSWYGVQCEADRVVHLTLRNNGLTGTLPDGWDRADHLLELDLSDNELRGGIPASFGSLMRLERLDCSGNQLTGQIPPELGDLADLGYLNLWRNGLSGGIPPTLGQLAHLRFLYLSNNQLTGALPAELGQLANVQDVWLDHNQLSGTVPPELAQLRSLRSLGLSHNRFASVSPALGALTDLTELNLYGNELSGTVPAWLGELVGLERLSLGGNAYDGISPELVNLDRLRRLDLSSNRFTGVIPAWIGRMTGLVRLDLSYNQFDGAIPVWLAELIHLDGLYLHDNRLQGSIPAELGGLTALEELTLDRNSLSGAIATEVGNLAELRYLSLSHNQLSGPLPPALGKLTHLRVLYLSANGFTGGLPPALGDLSGLADIRLDGNPLTGPLPRSLLKLHPEVFWYYDTQLCAPPDAAFETWLAAIPAGRNGLVCKYNYLPAVHRAGPTADLFWADHYQLQPGACTTLHWQVADARRVAFDDTNMAARESLQVCPAITAQHRLAVERANGAVTEYYLTVFVAAGDPWTGVDGDGNFYRGDPGAAIKMEEYMDFQCPYCARHVQQTRPLLDQAYVATGQVREVFRSFPLSIHPNAIPAAQAAYCAGQQGADYFWTLHDWLFRNQGAWRESSQPAAQLRAVALQVGVAAPAYDTCLTDEAVLAHIQRDAQAGIARGVGGIPAFYINDCPVLGAQPFAIFQAVIEKARQGLCTNDPALRLPALPERLKPH